MRGLVVVDGRQVRFVLSNVQRVSTPSSLFFSCSCQFFSASPLVSFFPSCLFSYIFVYCCLSPLQVGSISHSFIPASLVNNLSSPRFFPKRHSSESCTTSNPSSLEETSLLEADDPSFSSKTNVKVSCFCCTPSKGIHLRKKCSTTLVHATPRCWISHLNKNNSLSEC